MLVPTLSSVKCKVLQVEESYMSLVARALSCSTVCSGLGCECTNTRGADTLTILQHNNTKHCFCGDFQVQQSALTKGSSYK